MFLAESHHLCSLSNDCTGKVMDVSTGCVSHIHSPRVIVLASILLGFLALNALCDLFVSFLLR